MNFDFLYIISTIILLVLIWQIYQRNKLLDLVISNKF